MVGARHDLLRHREVEVDPAREEPPIVLQQLKNRTEVLGRRAVLEVELDRRDIAHADPGALLGFEHQPGHAAEPELVVLELQSAVLSDEVVERHPLFEVTVEGEGAAADREPVVDPVSAVDAGAKVQPLDLLGVVPPRPVVLVLRRPADIGAVPEAELEVRRHAVRVIERRAGYRTGRVAAVAARDRGAGVAIEVDVADHQLRADQQLRAVQAGHARPGCRTPSRRPLRSPPGPPTRCRDPACPSRISRSRPPWLASADSITPANKAAPQAIRVKTRAKVVGSRPEGCRQLVSAPLSDGAGRSALPCLRMVPPHFGNRNSTWNSSVQSAVGSSSGFTTL